MATRANLNCDRRVREPSLRPSLARSISFPVNYDKLFRDLANITTIESAAWPTGFKMFIHFTLQAIASHLQYAPLQGRKSHPGLGPLQPLFEQVKGDVDRWRDTRPEQNLRGGHTWAPPYEKVSSPIQSLADLRALPSFSSVLSRHGYFAYPAHLTRFIQLSLPHLAPLAPPALLQVLTAMRQGIHAQGHLPRYWGVKGLIATPIAANPCWQTGFGRASLWLTALICILQVHQVATCKFRSADPALHLHSLASAIEQFTFWVKNQPTKEIPTNFVSVIQAILDFCRAFPIESKPLKIIIPPKRMKVPAKTFFYSAKFIGALAQIRAAIKRHYKDSIYVAIPPVGSLGEMIDLLAKAAKGNLVTIKNPKTLPLGNLLDWVANGIILQEKRASQQQSLDTHSIRFEQLTCESPFHFPNGGREKGKDPLLEGPRTVEQELLRKITRMRNKLVVQKHCAYFLEKQDPEKKSDQMQATIAAAQKYDKPLLARLNILHAIRSLQKRYTTDIPSPSALATFRSCRHKRLNAIFRCINALIQYLKLNPSEGVPSGAIIYLTRLYRLKFLLKQPRSKASSNPGHKRLIATRREGKSSSIFPTLTPADPKAKKKDAKLYRFLTGIRRRSTYKGKIIPKQRVLQARSFPNLYYRLYNMLTKNDDANPRKPPRNQTPLEAMKTQLQNQDEEFHDVITKTFRVREGPLRPLASASVEESRNIGEMRTQLAELEKWRATHPTTWSYRVEWQRSATSCGSSRQHLRTQRRKQEQLAEIQREKVKKLAEIQQQAVTQEDVDITTKISEVEKEFGVQSDKMRNRGGPLGTVVYPIQEDAMLYLEQLKMEIAYREQRLTILTKLELFQANRQGSYSVKKFPTSNTNFFQRITGEFTLRKRPRPRKGVRHTFRIGVIMLLIFLCQEGIHIWEVISQNYSTPRVNDGSGISRYLQIDREDILTDSDLTFKFIAANSCYLRIEMFGIEDPNANEIGRVSIGIDDGDMEARESFTCFPGKVNTFKMDFDPEEWGEDPFALGVNATIYNLTVPAGIAPAIKTISIQPIVIANGYGETQGLDAEPIVHSFSAGGPVSVMFCGGVMDYTQTYVAIDAGTPDEIVLKDPIQNIDLRIPFILAASVATGSEVMQFDVNLRPGLHTMTVQGGNGTYIFDILNTGADWDADGVEDPVEYYLGKSNPMIDPGRTNIFGMLEEEMPCWTFTDPRLDPENAYPFGWVRGEVRFFIPDVLADWGYPLELTLECPFGLYTNFSLDSNPMEENLTLFGFNTASEEIIQATLPSGVTINLPAYDFNAWPERFLARLTTGEHTLQYLRRYDILDRPQLNLRIDNQYVIIIDRAIYPNSAADFGDNDGLPDDEDPSPDASLTWEKGTILQVTVPADQDAKEDYLIEFYVKKPTLAPEVEKVLLGEQIMKWRDAATVTIRPTLRIFGPGNAGRADKRGWWDLEGKDYWNSLAELSQFFEKPVKRCNVVAWDGAGTQHLQYQTSEIKYDGECDVLPLVVDLNAQGYYHLIFGEVAGETITFGPLCYPFDSPALQDSCIDIRVDVLWCVLESNEATGELIPLGWYDLDQDLTIQSISVKAISETNYVVARPSSAINSRVFLEYTKDVSVPISVNRQSPVAGRVGMDDLLRSEIIGEGQNVRFLPSYFYLDNETTTWGVAERALYDYHQEYFAGFANFTEIPAGEFPAAWGSDVPGDSNEAWVHVTDSLWGKDHVLQFYDKGSSGTSTHVSVWTSIPDIRAGSVTFNLSIGTSAEGFNFGLQHAGEGEDLTIAPFKIEKSLDPRKYVLKSKRGSNAWTILPIPEIVPERFHTLKIDFDLDSPLGMGRFNLTYDGTQVCTNWLLVDSRLPPNRLYFNTSATATVSCMVAIDEVSIQAKLASLMLNHSAVTYLCSTQRHLDLLNKINKSIYINVQADEQFLFYGGNDFAQLSPGTLIGSQRPAKWYVAPASRISIARNIVCHGNVLQVESGSLRRLYSNPIPNGSVGFSFNLPSDAKFSFKLCDTNQKAVIFFRTLGGYLEYRNGSQDWIKICKIWPEWFSLTIDFDLLDHQVEVNTGGVWISFQDNLLLGNPSAISIGSLLIEKEAGPLGCYFDDFYADWEPAVGSDSESPTYIEVHGGDLIQRVATSIVNDQYGGRYNPSDDTLQGDEQTLFTTHYSDALYEHARVEVTGIPLLVQMIRSGTATSGNFDFLDALNVTYGYAPDINLASLPWHSDHHWQIGELPLGVIYRYEFFLEVPDRFLGQTGAPTVNFDPSAGDLCFISINNRIQECNPLEMLVPQEISIGFEQAELIRSARESVELRTPRIAQNDPLPPSPAGHDITEIMALYQTCIRIMRSITLDRFAKQRQQILPELLTKYPDLLNFILLDPELTEGTIAGYIEQPDPDVLLWGTVPASALPADVSFKKVMELMELAERGEDSWETLWNTPNDSFIDQWTLSPFFDPQDFWQPDTLWDENTGNCQLFHSSGAPRQAWQLGMWVALVDADFSHAWQAGKISSDLKIGLVNHYGKPEIVNVNSPNQIPKYTIQWNVIGLNPDTGLPLDGSKLRADYIPKQYRDKIHPCAFSVLSDNFLQPPVGGSGLAGTRSGAAVKSIPIPVNFYWKYEMTLQLAQRRLSTYPLNKYLYMQKPSGQLPASAPQMDLGNGKVVTIHPRMNSYASVFNTPTYPPSAVCTIDDLIKQGVDPSVIQLLKSGKSVDDLVIKYNCIDAFGKVHDTISISAFCLNQFVYATSLGWKSDPQWDVVGARPSSIFQGGSMTMWIQNYAVYLLNHLYSTLIKIACGDPKASQKSDFPMISEGFWQELDQAVDKKGRIFTGANDLGKRLAQSDLINRECWSIQGPGKRTAILKILRKDPFVGKDIERLYSGSNYFGVWDNCPFIKLLLAMYPTNENRLKFVQFLAPSTGKSPAPFPGGPRWFEEFWTKAAILGQALTPMSNLGREKIYYYLNGEILVVGKNSLVLPLEAEWKFENEVTRLLCNIDNKIVVFRKSYSPGTRIAQHDASNPQYLAISQFILQQSKATNSIFQASLPEIQEAFKKKGIPVPRSPAELVTLVLKMNGWSEEYARVFLAEFHRRNGEGGVNHNPLPFLAYWDAAEIARKVTEFCQTGEWELDPMLQGCGTWKEIQIRMNNFWIDTMDALLGQITLGQKTGITKTEWIMLGMGQEVEVQLDYNEQGRLITKVYLLPSTSAPKGTSPLLLGERVMAIEGEITPSLRNEFERIKAGRKFVEIKVGGKRVFFSFKRFLEQNLKQLWKWDFIQQKEGVVKLVESGDVMAWLQRFNGRGTFPMNFKATEEVRVDRMLQQIGALEQIQPNLAPYVVINGKIAQLGDIIHVGDKVQVSFTSFGGGWIASQQLPVPDLPSGDSRSSTTTCGDGFQDLEFEVLPGYKYQRNLYGMQLVARKWAINWFADRCVERLEWVNLQGALMDVLDATQAAQLDLKYMWEIESGRPLISTEFLENYWRARWGVVDQGIVTILTSLLLLSSALQRGTAPGEPSISTIGFAVSTGVVEALQINSLVQSIRANHAWKAAGGEIFDVANYRPAAKLSLKNFGLPLLIDIVTTFWSGWDYAAALMAQGSSRELAISAAVNRFLPPIFIEAVVDTLVQFVISEIFSTGTAALIAGSSIVGFVLGTVIALAVQYLWQSILDWIDATWYPNNPSIYMDSSRQVLDMTESLLRHGGMRVGDEITYSVTFKNDGLNSFWYRQRAAAGPEGLDSGTGTAWDQAMHYTLSGNLNTQWNGGNQHHNYYGSYEETTNVGTWLSSYGSQIFLPNQTGSNWIAYQPWLPEDKHNGWAGSNFGQWPIYPDINPEPGRYYPDENLVLAPSEYDTWDGDNNEPANWDMFMHRCPLLEATSQLHLYVQNQIEFYYNSVQYPGRRETPPASVQDIFLGDSNGDGYIDPVYERPVRVLEGTLGDFISHCEKVESPPDLGNYWSNFTSALRNYQFYDAMQLGDDLIYAAEERTGMSEDSYYNIVTSLIDPIVYATPSISALNLTAPATNQWITAQLPPQVTANYYLLNAQTNLAWESYLGTLAPSLLFALGWRAANPGIGTMYQQEFDAIEDQKLPLEWHANVGWPVETSAPLHIGVQNNSLCLDDHSTSKACEAWVDIGSLYKGTISWDARLDVQRIEYGYTPVMNSKYGCMSIVQSLPDGGWTEVINVEIVVDAASWGRNALVFTNGRLVASFPVTCENDPAGSDMFHYFTPKLSFHISLDSTTSTYGIVIDGEGIQPVQVDGISLLVPAIADQFRVRTGFLEGGGMGEAYSLYLDDVQVECWDWHGSNLNGRSRTLLANQILVPFDWVVSAFQSFRYINETQTALQRMPIRVNVKATPSWPTTPVLDPGQYFTGSFSFSLAGMSDNPTCKWTLQGPEGWEIWPQEGTSRLWSLPSINNPLSFTLHAPESALAGIYYLTLSVTIVDGVSAGNVTYFARFPLRVRYNTSLGIDLLGFPSALEFGQVYKWGTLENTGSVPQYTSIATNTTLPGAENLYGDRFNIVSRWDFPGTACGFHVKDGPGMLAIQEDILVLFTQYPSTASFAKNVSYALTPGDVLKIRYRSTVHVPILLHAGETTQLGFTGSAYSEITYTYVGFSVVDAIEVTGTFGSGEYFSIDYIEIAKTMDRRVPLAEFAFPWITSYLGDYGWISSLETADNSIASPANVINTTYIYQGEGTGYYGNQNLIHVGASDYYRGFVQLPQVPPALSNYANFSNVRRYLLLKPESAPVLGNLTLWECEWNWTAGASLTWDTQPLLANWWYDNATSAEDLLGAAYAGWYLWDITGFHNSTACIRVTSPDSWTFYSNNMINTPENRYTPLVVYISKKTGVEDGSLVIQTDRPAGEEITVLYNFLPMFGNVTMHPGDKIWVSYAANTSLHVILSMNFTGQLDHTFLLSNESTRLNAITREFTYEGVVANLSSLELQCQFARPAESFKLNFLGIYRYQSLGRPFEITNATGLYNETLCLVQVAKLEPGTWMDLYYIAPSRETSLSAGTYSFFTVLSDSTGIPLGTLSQNVTIPPYYDMTFTNLSSTDFIGVAGDKFTIYFNLTNLGNTPEEFFLTIEGLQDNLQAEWSGPGIQYNPSDGSSSINLAPDSSIELTLTLEKIGGGTEIFFVSATSATSPSASETITIQIVDQTPSVILNNSIWSFEWGQLNGPVFWTWIFTDPGVTPAAYFEINWQKQDPAFNFIPGQEGSLDQGALHLGTTTSQFDIVAFGNTHGPGRYVFTGTFGDGFTAPQDLGIFILEVTNNLKPVFELCPSVDPYYYDGIDRSISFMIQDESSLSGGSYEIVISPSVYGSKVPHADPATGLWVSGQPVGPIKLRDLLVGADMGMSGVTIFTVSIRAYDDCSEWGAWANYSEYAFQVEVCNLPPVIINTSPSRALRGTTIILKWQITDLSRSIDGLTGNIYVWHNGKIPDPTDPAGNPIWQLLTPTGISFKDQDSQEYCYSFSFTDPNAWSASGGACSPTTYKFKLEVTDHFENSPLVAAIIENFIVVGDHFWINQLQDGWGTSYNSQLASISCGSSRANLMVTANADWWRLWWGGFAHDAPHMQCPVPSSSSWFVSTSMSYNAQPEGSHAGMMLYEDPQSVILYGIYRTGFQATPSLRVEYIRRYSSDGTTWGPVGRTYFELPNAGAITQLGIRKTSSGYSFEYIASGIWNSAVTIPFSWLASYVVYGGDGYFAYWDSLDATQVGFFVKSWGMPVSSWTVGFDYLDVT